VTSEEKEFFVEKEKIEKYEENGWNLILLEWKKCFLQEWLYFLRHEY